MLINCPSCGKRISNKHKACPHCHYDISGTGAGVPLEQAASRVRERKLASVRQQSHLAMLVTLAGVAGIWVETGGLNLPAASWSLFVFGGGALWYLVTRLMWFWLRIVQGRD